jgi:PadR family transcriptional regulator PadR
MPRQSNVSPQTLRVLQLLLEEADAWHYGYELSRQTALKPGTLYPLLVRLADQGWLETSWEEPTRPGRPPRHLYRLTPMGWEEATARVIDASRARGVTRLHGQEASR